MQQHWQHQLSAAPASEAATSRQLALHPVTTAWLNQQQQRQQVVVVLVAVRAVVAVLLLPVCQRHLG